MYPNPPGSAFNTEYYLNVHLPVAIGLLQRSDIAPERIEILTNGHGMDGTVAGAPYHCVSNLYFRTLEDADKLLVALGSEEAARLLQADWPNYTQAEPIAQISHCHSLDPAQLIANEASQIATPVRGQASNRAHADDTIPPGRHSQDS
jgi:hypothetical protein